MSSLSDYLAKKYLTADPAPSTSKPKKRKRKDTTTTGLIIADDDDDDNNNRRKPLRLDDDDNDPTTLHTSSADFRKAKKNAWTTIGAPLPTHADQAAADAIIASTAAENALRSGADVADSAPQIVPSSPQTIKMQSGANAGLQTAAQVRAALETRQALERARLADATSSTGLQTHETIYRDASGRIINVAMKRADARRAADAAAAAALAATLALAGDVQIAARADKARALDDAKYMGVARRADDKELNDELRAQQRWNDPAAGFLAKKEVPRSKGGRPLYKGAAPPNRHGVRPGFRWDGVDRGNGFEGKWFAARNKKESLRDLQYAWQTDE